MSPEVLAAYSMIFVGVLINGWKILDPGTISKNFSEALPNLVSVGVFQVISLALWIPTSSKSFTNSSYLGFTTRSISFNFFST